MCHNLSIECLHTLKMKLWPFINLISCVYACPTTTASTTTTIKPSTTISGSRTYHEFYKFSHMRYTGCRSNENVACQLLELNLTALIHENDFKIDLTENRIGKTLFEFSHCVHTRIFFVKSILSKLTEVNRRLRN